MSLHVLADHMASKGRNGDSMLVHMTPGEVAGLHALAIKHGGQLTINPDTGLPEANFLKSLLPMLAGAALNFFVPGLGAAVGGAFGLGAAAGTGIAVGGLTSLATGSLSRGLMAGLGAYGGAGLTEGLMGAGAQQLATTGAPIAENVAGAAIPPIEQVNPSNFAMSNADKLSAGVQGLGTEAGRASALANMGGTSGALKYAGAAAAPIAADMMVPTTTKMPTPTDTGYIRQKIVNPDGTVRDLTPVKAADWGNRSFSDIYRGYNGGGIVALADGGAVQHFDIGGEAKSALEAAYAANDVAKINEIASANKITAADIADTYKGFDTSGIQGLQLYTPPAAQAAPAYTQYTPEQMGSFLSNPVNKDIDLNKAIAETNADPAAVNRYIASLTSPFVGSTDTKGGSGTLGIYSNMVAKGVDPNEEYAALIANDPNYAGWTKEMIQKGYNLDKGAYALTEQIAKDKIAADSKLGYDKQWVNFMDTNKYSIDDMAQAFGLSRNEVKARYDAVKAAEAASKVVKPVTTLPTTPLTTTATVLPTNPQTNAPIGTTNPYGNVNNPGDLTFNPDGTVTVQPNIPGRPYGGFSGMGEVKNAYTAGGGSLGYIPRAPRTVEEFNQMYNKQTGDSLAAYDYLMGKGANPIKSNVGEIATPYRESVMGYPASTNKMYNYDAATGKMVRNPDYVAPGRNASGNVTYGMSLNDIKKYLGTSPLQGQALYDWAKTNSLSAEDIAAATGMKLSDVYAQFRTGQAADAKKTDTTTTDTGVPYDGGGGPGGGEAAGGLQSSFAMGGYAVGGGLGSLGSYSDGGRLLKGPGDGVSDSIPATIGAKGQPARLADGEFVVPARIVSELGNGSTDAGAKKLYAMMDRVQRARGKTTGKNKVAANSRADKYLPA